MVPKLRFKEFCGEWEEKNMLELIKNKKGSIKIGPFGSALKKECFIEKGIKVYAQENIFKNDFNIGNYYISSKKYEELKSCQLEEGDLVISMMGTIGSCAIFPKNAQIGIMNSHLLRLQFKENIDTRIIEQQLRFSENIKYQIEKLSVGSIMSGLSSSVVKKLIFNLPSLPEQTKIADFLSTVDNKIQNQQDKITHLENIKKGFMQKIFSRKIRFKDDGGEEFPEWEEKKLVDCCKYQSSSISTSMISNSGEYQLFDVNGKIGYTNKFCDKKYISIIKDGAGVGRIRILPKNSFCISTMGIITSNKQTIIEYLYYSMSQIEFKKYVVGAAIPHIYFKDYRNEKIEVPCLKEQTKIADFLSSFDEKISIEKETLEHLKQLKKGLLQQMFV